MYTVTFYITSHQTQSAVINSSTHISN